jgi:tetratricopeptide (TPR) repeat protein
MLLLMRQPAEALPHVQRELEIEPGNEAGQAKLGTIHLMLGDIAVARTDFAKGLAAATTPGSRYMFMHWQAVADVYARDGRSALRQLTLIGTTAKAAANAGAAANAHEQAGVVEAYLGNRRLVAGHFAAAIAASPERPAGHYVLKAIALSRAGDPAGARAALTQSESKNGYDASVAHYANAVLALDARDVVAAEAAAKQIAATDQFSKAIWAEVLTRKGQRTEGAALRAEVMASSVKQNGNAPVNYAAVLARMRAEQMR